MVSGADGHMEGNHTGLFIESIGVRIYPGLWLENLVDLIHLAFAYGFLLSSGSKYICISEITQINMFQFLFPVVIFRHPELKEKQQKERNPVGARQINHREKEPNELC